MLFADARYDEPFDGQPTLTFMICGARRTGTTWLGRLLWATGRLGKPFEYQLPECRRKITERMPFGVSYWDFLRRQRTTPNGVFGFKEVAPAQYNLRNLVPDRDKVIYLTRRNEVAQAVSLTLALQTAAFFSFQDEKREPAYDYDALMNTLIGLIEVKDAWEDVFVRDDITPLRLVYEDLSPRTVPQVADFLGVELTTNHASVVPFLRRQRTALNRDWETRFRKDLNANDCSITC